jgi:succinate dehydrogenase/fumarate reductase cytochrome b subunit
MKLLLPILAGLLVPVQASAVRITQYGWNCLGFIGCGSTTDAVTQISSNIFLVVGLFVETLAILVFIYGGIRMIFSRGEEGKEAGKKALIYASIGFVLAILSSNIILYVSVLIRCIATGDCSV